MLLAAKKKLIRSVSAGEDDFIFTINTALGSGNSFQLPLPSGQTYNFVVKWGDGNEDTITAYNQSETLHNYSSGGTYEISISGKCGGWSFANTGDKLKLISVNQWGDVQLDYLVSGFYGCINLTALPSESIKNTTGNINNLGSCLRGTGISTLSALTFSELVNVTTFANCFQDSLIATIPIDLFRYNVSVTSFASVFNNCDSLTAIVVDLFRYNTSVTTFASAFESCGNIAFTTIPVDIFRYNTAVTNFTSVFQSCLRITSLPTDIFRYNTLVTTFASAFAFCSAITSIPNNLFFYNSLVTNYSNVFWFCRNISLPATIFNLSNLSIVTTFNNFMSTNSVSFSNTGTIQDVWNYALSSTSVDAFLNQTSLSNYASIPNNWKGL